MQAFPHHYAVVATADMHSDVALEGKGLPPIASAPPTEFGGPGDRWSPETLLVAAVADCFVLTKAEETCLVTNSLKVTPHLESIVDIEES